MPSRMKITTYEQAFKLIGVPWPMNQKFKALINNLEGNGHTERSISFAIWKENENLCKAWVHGNRFWMEFENCILKWSWPAGDPRWDKYWAKKKELKKARESQQKLSADNKDRVHAKRYNSDTTGFVYFIQGESGGPIKIGYTTDIERRLKDLQTGYPDILKLLMAFRGNQEYEKALHKQLQPYRLSGEWFKPDPAIYKKMNELSALNLEIKHRRSKPKTTWNDYC